MRISGKYETYEEVKRREEREGKNKWISNKNFINNVGKSLNPHYIQNYVVKDPSKSPKIHKFRTDNKKQWISGAFII